MKFGKFNLLIAVLLTTSSLQAFDDKREGFIVGLGMGYSYINNELKSNTNSKFHLDSNNNHALATSFKIGYGFSEQFSVYYLSNVSWYKFDSDKADDTYTTGMSALAASYYLDPCGPWYLTGGIGLGGIRNFSEESSISGGGFMLGAGYEIAPHMSIEGNIMTVAVDEKEVDFGAVSFNLTWNYLWY